MCRRLLRSHRGQTISSFVPSRDPLWSAFGCGFLLVHVMPLSISLAGFCDDRSALLHAASGRARIFIGCHSGRWSFDHVAAASQRKAQAQQFCRIPGPGIPLCGAVFGSTALSSERCVVCRFWTDCCARFGGARVMIHRSRVVEGEQDCCTTLKFSRTLHGNDAPHADVSSHTRFRRFCSPAWPCTD